MPNPLYDAQHRLTRPVAELLDAVFEVNWHLHRATREGWEITLSVADGLLAISVYRAAEWPTDDSEAEAASQ